MESKHCHGCHLSCPKIMIINILSVDNTCVCANMQSYVNIRCPLETFQAWWANFGDSPWFTHHIAVGFFHIFFFCLLPKLCDCYTWIWFCRVKLWFYFLSVKLIYACHYFFQIVSHICLVLSSQNANTNCFSFLLISPLRHDGRVSKDTLGLDLLQGLIWCLQASFQNNPFSWSALYFSNLNSEWYRKLWLCVLFYVKLTLLRLA